MVIKTRITAWGVEYCAAHLSFIHGSQRQAVELFLTCAGACARCSRRK
jgi:hypothetical protein